jgi:hypothetical protein
MSEKRLLETDTDPSPKIKLVAAPDIASSKTPIYNFVSVICGKCDRSTTVLLCLRELPIEIQALFDSIHYDSENCPRTEEAVAAEHEHSPEEQAFKLQLKCLIEPLKWSKKEKNICNDPKWLAPLELDPGKRKGGKMSYLQDFDIMKGTAEALGDVLLKSAEISSQRVRRFPRGAILEMGSFFVPESWILEASMIPKQKLQS